MQDAMCAYVFAYVTDHQGHSEVMESPTEGFAHFIKKWLNKLSGEYTFQFTTAK